MVNRLNAVNPEQHNAAKVAALAFLIPMLFVVYANFGMRGGLRVGSDMAETVRQVAAGETLFPLRLWFRDSCCRSASARSGAGPRPAHYGAAA
jgi:hypothetical protein